MTGVDDPLGELLDLVGRPGWHRDALCREHPEVSFFPGPGELVQPALQLCGRCVVMVECREYALGHPLIQGVWGGTTPRARIVMRRARGRSS